MYEEEARKIREIVKRKQANENTMPEDVDYDNLRFIFDTEGGYEIARFFDIDKFDLYGNDTIYENNVVKIVYDLNFETGEVEVKSEKAPVTLNGELAQAFVNRLSEHEGMAVSMEWEGKRYNAEPSQTEVTQAGAQSKDSTAPVETQTTDSVTQAERQAEKQTTETKAQTELEQKEESKLNEVKTFLKEFLPIEEEIKVEVDPSLKAKGSFSIADKIIKVRSPEDVETVIHEGLHQFALTLTPEEIESWKALEKTVKELPNPKGRAHNFDLTTREGIAVCRQGFTVYT